MDLTPGLLEAGIKVVDLSAAFRLRTPDTYKQWYGHDHTAPAYLPEAVYGLPEFYRDLVRPARLVANPGCYPTAANLAIRPLVDAGIADLSAGIVCDAKSGTSGAGRKPSLKTSFCEVTENFSAYSILNHRHVPEVLMNSAPRRAAVQLHGAPASLRARHPRDDLLPGGARDRRPRRFWRSMRRPTPPSPSSALYDPGVVPDLRAVERTNFCDIGFKFDARTGRGVVVSAIDNLVKGAAGQAVQNMNLMLGFEETEGLL